MPQQEQDGRHANGLVQTSLWRVEWLLTRQDSDLARIEQRLIAMDSRLAAIEARLGSGLTATQWLKVFAALALPLMVLLLTGNVELARKMLMP